MGLLLRDSTAGVHSSGIDANRGKMSEIISSCLRVVVVQDRAFVIAGRDEWGPVQKVRVNVNQSIIGLVLQSHGRLSTMGAEG